jgi:hypothetical protein
VTCNDQKELSPALMGKSIERIAGGYGALKTSKPCCLFFGHEKKGGKWRFFTRILTPKKA